MASDARGSRVAAILWIIASVLAWAAVAIRYVRRDEVNWALAAAGLFFFAAGLSASFRARQASAASADADRSPRPPT